MANKKRLIDANELLRIYKKWIPQLALPEDEGDKRGVETCIAVLEDQPTVDAAPVVHGQWEFRPSGKYKFCIDAVCTACNSTIDTNPENSLEYRQADIKKKMRYCPNCGAKMDGGVSNEKR